MKLSKDSLHYRLFSVYGNGENRYNLNVCYYMQRCLVGLVLIGCAIGLGTLMSMLILEPLAVLLAWYFSGWFNPGYFLPGGGLYGSIVLYGAVTLLTLWALGCKQYDKWYDNRKHFEEDGTPVDDTFIDVVRLWFKGINDKVCYTIEFKEEKK